MKSPDFTQSEIVIVTFPDTAKEIQLLIKAHLDDLKATSNTVIWTVNRIPKTDQLLTKLFYGKHIDEKLNAAMVKGVYCKPPAREFLSSPDIPDSRFASIIGRRFLVSIATGTKTSTDVRFLEENKDLTVSFARLRRIMASLFRLVPELGSYERRKGTINLKSRVDYSAVQNRLLQIGQISKIDYSRALGEPIEREVPTPVEKLKPTKQISLLGFIRKTGKKSSEG